MATDTVTAAVEAGRGHCALHVPIGHLYFFFFLSPVDGKRRIA